MARDYYEILGVDRGASQEDIKKAYRRLSKELHPDKNKGDKDVEHRYKEVNEAYETINNPKKRQAYDQFGKAGTSGTGGFGGFNQEDLGGFSDIFESFFGGARGGRGHSRDESGSNIEVQITIDFDVVINGGKRTITLRRQKQCKKCDGSGIKKGSKLISCNTCGGTGQVTHAAQSFFGTIQQSFICQDCHGKGQIPEEICKHCSGEGRNNESSDVTIDIPAGIHDGQTLRVQEEGEAGRQGAPAGDLFVHIRIEQDERFNRDGDDIRSTVSIPVADAILGTEVSVETVHGKVKLKIPDGTQPGQIFRLKGKGLPVLNTSRHGNHYVTAKVDVPKKLSKKERQLLEEWKKLQK